MKQGTGCRESQAHSGPLSGQSGFTLLEVLVAVSIVGIALVVLLRLHLLSLDATLAAQDLSTAVLLAQGRMAILLAQSPPPGEDEGQYDEPDLERFRWTTSVRQFGLGAEDEPGSAGVRHVTVSVHWREGNRNRTYRLETYEAR